MSNLTEPHHQRRVHREIDGAQRPERNSFDRYTMDFGIGLIDTEDRNPVGVLRGDNEELGLSMATMK